jgi:hypothetical protein
MSVLGNNEFYGALDAIRQLISVASELAKIGRESTSLTEAFVRERLIRAKTGLTEIQETYESLVATKLDLEQQVVKLKAWEEVELQYQPREIVSGGTIAYAKTPQAGPASKPEWLCPKCFHNAHKSFLVLGTQANHETATCPECRLILRLRPINRLNTHLKR